MPNQTHSVTPSASDVLYKLINMYTAERKMMIIATCANVRQLNKRVQKARGSFTFHDTTDQMPELDAADRRRLLEELCLPLHFRKQEEFVEATQSYGVGDLVDLAQRAVFLAHKEQRPKPVLRGAHLQEALSVTNQYCLPDIQSNDQQRAVQASNANGDGDSDSPVPSSDEEEYAEPREQRKRRTHPHVLPDSAVELPGLQHVTEVLEQVLLWPARFRRIFCDAPLRNQAGVLLFGPPGTGKTYAVGKLARMWRLRLITVKGPELLAKFIGQSEENVRKVFDRARKSKPCVLFFDEFDSLAAK